MNKLQYLFSEHWSVRNSALRNLVAVITPCVVAGKPTEAEAILAERHIETRLAQPGASTFGRWSAEDEDLPEGSIIIFQMQGMLYRWETSLMSELLDAAEANPKVGGIIFRIDGPGGMAGGVPALAEKIKTLSKPTATVVEGQMCSAHLFIGCSADRVFVTSRYCEIGSIGAMTSYMSFKKLYEKEGIISKDIYPDSSDMKNFEYRALEENDDETPIKEKLAQLHSDFAQHVASCRGISCDGGTTGKTVYQIKPFDLPKITMGNIADVVYLGTSMVPSIYRDSNNLVLYMPSHLIPWYHKANELKYSEF